MKKFILPLLLLIFIIASPAVSNASYVIYLKNGGRLLSSYYWRENNEIKIYTMGGVIGIDKNAVRKIEKSKYVFDESKNSYRNTTQNAPQIKHIQPTEEIEINKEEPFDLKFYQSEKNGLMIELDDLMEKKRKAASIGDNDAKEKIKQKIRQTSGQIYKLTDEVTEKNKGKLPEGWWEKTR